MKTFKSHLPRLFLLVMLGLSSISVFAANTSASATESTTVTTLKFDNTAWHYDSKNDVYWQIGIVYALNPATTNYESLGVYVPGAYLTATDNGNGTFTATINTKGAVGSYTTATAPIVFPVNTPGYSAQAAPTSYNYDGISSYLKAGFIYVQAGMRGRNNGYDANGKLIYSGGAPWGVTDLKAAVRYYRYNEHILPGSKDRIFVFGMSGGGAQGAVMGATGDSELYIPYLKSIGAAMVDSDGKTISDAVNGAMVWCPITTLDYADEAYEWNMGQYASTNGRATGTWTSALSKDLAGKYADYLNALGLTDKDGNVLRLEKSTNSIYAAGSYYDYLLRVVEQSLNNFLTDTTFPYTKTAGGPMGGGFPGGKVPDGQMPQGDPARGNATGTTTTSTTYSTAQAYIDGLNANGKWINYDPATKKATITSLAAFVASQKSATKSVTAFDSLNRSQAENMVFGNDASDALHFDFTVADLLTANQTKYAAYSDWNTSIIDAYATDLKAVDTLGNGIQYRQNMYNPITTG